MQNLTDFQVATEKELTERLREKGLTLTDRQIGGTTEPFVIARVNDVTVWIYLDGACVIGRGVDRVFEKWDYSSLQELRAAFVDRVISLFDFGRRNG